MHVQEVAKKYNLKRREKRRFNKIYDKKRHTYIKKIYKEKTEIFFMLKDFPENKTRFNIPKINDLIK